MNNLTPKQLEDLSRERLTDAEVLYEAGRLEGAFYICGYAVEMGLKSKICKTLDWDQYPGKEDNYKSFKTHKLDALLHFSGIEKRKNTFFAEWSIVMKWDPEIRYSFEKMTAETVKSMIQASKTVLNQL